MSTEKAAGLVTPAEALMEAVQDQRSKLINVLGVVQCMQIAVRSSDPPQELEGAVELLEEELQRILDGLDPITLGRVVKAEETQP